MKIVNLLVILVVLFSVSCRDQNSIETNKVANEINQNGNIISETSAYSFIYQKLKSPKEVAQILIYNLINDPKNIIQKRDENISISGKEISVNIQVKGIYGTISGYINNQGFHINITCKDEYVQVVGIVRDRNINFNIELKDEYIKTSGHIYEENINITGEIKNNSLEINSFVGDLSKKYFLENSANGDESFEDNILKKFIPEIL